jgi:Cytochrome P450
MDSLQFSPTNMPPSVVLTVLGVMAAVFFYQFILYPLFLSPLSRVPGPKLAALSTLYLNYHWYRETAIPLIEILHEKYGPIVRIGPSELVINDPEQLPPIYGVRSTLMKCPQIVMFGNHRALNTFSSITKEEHKQRRKTITQVYAVTSLYNNMPLLDFLRNRLERVNSAAEAALGKTLDVLALSKRFAVDNVTFQVYGDSLNLLGGHNLQHAENISNTIIGAAPMWRFETILNILSLRPLRFLLPAFIKKMLDSQNDLEAMNLRQIEKVTNSKEATLDPKKTTVECVRYHVKQDTTLTENHVASECLDNVVAG